MTFINLSRQPVGTLAEHNTAQPLQESPQPPPSYLESGLNSSQSHYGTKDQGSSKQFLLFLLLLISKVLYRKKNTLQVSIFILVFIFFISFF